jgi:hypothetical protein
VGEGKRKGEENKREKLVTTGKEKGKRKVHRTKGTKKNSSQKMVAN